MATYASVSDLKSLTRNPLLAAESTTVLTRYIEEAELIIDQYVCFTDTPEDQTLKFPLRGETTIPSNVKYATIYQVEYMYEGAADLEHGVSDDSGGSNTRGRKYDTVSHRAKHMLKDFRQIVGKPFTIKENVFDY